MPTTTLGLWVRLTVDQAGEVELIQVRDSVATSLTFGPSCTRLARGTARDAAAAGAQRSGPGGSACEGRLRRHPGVVATHAALGRSVRRTGGRDEGTGAIADCRARSGSERGLRPTSGVRTTDALVRCPVDRRYRAGIPRHDHPRPQRPGVRGRQVEGPRAIRLSQPRRGASGDHRGVARAIRTGSRQPADAGRADHPATPGRTASESRSRRTPRAARSSRWR